MKKFILFILFLFVSSPVFAGMNCYETVTSLNDGKWLLEVELQFDTTPGTASCTISGSVMNKINTLALYIYEITACNISGETGVTENSDLAIADSEGKTIVSASGNGANVLDNATCTGPFYGDNNDGGNHYAIGTGKNWTITVTNNAVNNSFANISMVGVE